MNTYRVFLLNTADVEAPVVETVFFQATKYQDAWSGARAVLAGKTEAEDRKFFTDQPATKAWKAPKDVSELTVVKILDCTVRNKKLDKATLADILADESLSQEEKLVKISALNK